ncbi:14-3-3 domain-containing protein [Syncephalis fuscata]|nr:14-3-3 domain-containing protein [Syncephalis fuscata]
MSTDRVALIEKAAQAQTYGRYEEMFESIVKAIRIDKNVNLEEMKLLSFAYKTVIALRRARWRMLNMSEERVSAEGDNLRIEQVKQDRSQVRDELLKICQEFDSIFGENLIRDVQPAECHLLYYKMKGNYYRFMTEFSLGPTCQESVAAAEIAYVHATEIARSKFEPVHSLRLHVALNHATFRYEICNDTEHAYEIAQKAVDEADAMINDLSEKTYHDSIFMLKLLKDQLSVWDANF